MSVDRSHGDFDAAQRAHFVEADVDQYRWTTTAPGIAETEDELLAPLLAHVAPPCLEIGCGEGNNLHRLAEHVPCFGIDRFPRKLQFASREHPKSRFAAADAAQLPFRDATFASVFIRDLLHHVPSPAATLAEALRVLRPGGRLCILEPNGRNPLIHLQTRLVPAEIGARDSTPDNLRALFDDLPVDDLRIEARQPLALRRTALHYRMGMPALGEFPPTRWLLAGAEAVLGSLLPRSRWTYIEITAIRDPLR